jgi:hypothetical protein
LRLHTTSWKASGSTPDEVTDIYRLHYGKWLKHPQTEMNTRNFLVSKGRLVRKADTITAICEQIFYKF